MKERNKWPVSFPVVSDVENVFRLVDLHVM